MIRIFIISAFFAVFTGCSVEVISDKEAIERFHKEEAKELLADAEQMALLFANTPVNLATTEVKVSDYNDSPIFVTHAKRLEEQGLSYDSSQLFTTEAYEDALAIQTSYKNKKSTSVTADDENSHTH